MRNLAMGLFDNYSQLIISTALEIKSCQNKEDSDCDLSRKIALERLMPLRRELVYYHNFRLEKVDMLKVANVLTDILGPHDPKYVDGKLDTTNGNESVILQTGVIIASLIGNQRMLQTVASHNQLIADYLSSVHDIYIVDPGDKRIEEIAQKFITDNPVDADIVSSLLDGLTKIYTEEIKRIGEAENYLAKHIFSTGFSEYPGIGFEITRLQL